MTGGNSFLQYVFFLYCIYFLCFLILGGYLPFRFFQWTNLNGKASQHYISARCYTTAGLCRLFGGMNPELLPLCAVLTGNDYSMPKDTETLLSLLDAKGLGRAGKSRSPPSRIEGILLWLSPFKTAAEALQEVSSIMGDEGGRGMRGQKGGLASELWAGMQEYHIKSPSSLAHWFSGGKGVLGGQTSGLGQLPECLSTAALQGRLPPLALDALVMRRVLLIPQVENSKLASSHCSSRAIRQALYGILLRRSQENAAQGRVVGAQVAKGPGDEIPKQDIKMEEKMRQGMRGGGGRGGRGFGGRGQGQSFTPQQDVGIGLGKKQEAGPATAQGPGTLICVEEYDRLDLNVKKNQVEVLPLRNHVDLDRLGQVNILQN